MKLSTRQLPEPLTYQNDDALLIALFCAALVHIAALLLVFNKNQQSHINQAIEITIAHAPLKKAPKQATFLADEHQLGAGETTVKPEHKMETPPTPKPISARNQTGVNKENAPEKKKLPAPALITQPQAPAKIAADKEATEPADEQAAEKPKITNEWLQQQIAQQGEAIRTSKPTAEQSRIKYVNSVSSHKFMAAQYMKDWGDKVERIGNLNYPDAARQKRSVQTLTMDVGIKADGGINHISIVKSSGNPALDEAAKQIVKMSAPFAELPYDLLKELDVLVITRVWQFSDETGMTAR